MSGRKKSQARPIPKDERERSGAGPRVGRLNSLTTILSELSAVYREARYGQIPLADAAKLAFILQVMRLVLETQILERIEARVAALENPTAPRAPDQMALIEPPRMQ